MAWVAVDKNKSEWTFSYKPSKMGFQWLHSIGQAVAFPKGSIEKLIGKKLTWEDEPVELKE